MTGRRAEGARLPSIPDGWSGPGAGHLLAHFSYEDMGRYGIHGWMMDALYYIVCTVCRRNLANWNEE